MIGTVVIPAYNEADVIGPCLSCLLAQDIAHWRVVVVANGCEDNTSHIAGTFIDRFAQANAELHVTDLPDGHKPSALNTGDTHAVGQIRVYMDADVRMQYGCLAAMTRSLSNAIHACFPTVVYEPNRSIIAMLHWRTWRTLTNSTTDSVVGNCIALSIEGRSRWSTFPDLISDDGFMISRFAKQERTVAPDAVAHTRLPSTFREIVGVRARWRAGHRQLADRVGKLNVERAQLARIGTNPVAMLGLPVFAVATYLARREASFILSKPAPAWYQARSSRKSASNRAGSSKYQL